MSERPAVYRLYDAAGDLLYIGLTYRKPSHRWREHRATKPWWPQVARKDVAFFDRLELAAAEERRAILAESPRHNAARWAPSPVSSEKTRGVPPTEAQIAARLADLADARREYDAARVRLSGSIQAALDDPRISISAIACAAKFTREYIAKIRDGRQDPA